jgi:hypothetical protein
MKRARFTDEQIVRILQEADRSPVAEMAKRHGVQIRLSSLASRHKMRLLNCLTASSGMSVSMNTGLNHWRTLGRSSTRGGRVVHVCTSPMHAFAGREKLDFRIRNFTESF